MPSCPGALNAAADQGQQASCLYPLRLLPSSTHAKRRRLGVAAVLLCVSLAMTHRVLSFNAPPVALALFQAIVLFFVTTVPVNAYGKDQGQVKNESVADQLQAHASNKLASPWPSALAVSATLALTNVALAVSPSALIVQVVMIASDILLARWLLSDPVRSANATAHAPVVLPLTITYVGATIFLLGSFAFGPSTLTGSGEWIVPATASIVAAVARIAAHVLIIDPKRETRHSSGRAMVGAVLPRTMAVLALIVAFVELPSLLRPTQLSATLSSTVPMLDFPWISLGTALVTSCIANRIHPSYSQASPAGPALVAGFFGTGTGVAVRTGLGPRVELVASLKIAGGMAASVPGNPIGVLTSQWWVQALGILMMVSGMRVVHAVDSAWRIRYQSLPHASASVDAGNHSQAAGKLDPASPDSHFTYRRRRPALLLLFSVLSLVSLAVLALMTATGSDPSSSVLDLLLHRGKDGEPSASAGHDKHTIQESQAPAHDKPKRTKPKPAPSVADLMHQLWTATNDPTRLSWDWRKSSPGGASLPSLPGSARTPRVLVMHADNRPLKTLESVGNDPFALDYLTVGPLYTMSWALRFGYDYRRLSLTGSKLAKPYKIGGWNKPKIIYDALHRYDYVVFFDADAYVTNTNVSLAYMIKRWGFHESASMMMALDPPNQAPNNWNATNTGFWVLRSTPRAKEIVRDLAMCPDRPECQKWLVEFAAEQSAFTKLIRPKLVEGQDLIIAPCEEANGWWAVGPCKGTIITHAWSGKGQVVRDMMMRLLTEQVKLLERLLMNGYHSMDSCTPWVTGKDERCRFIEDVDFGDPIQHDQARLGDQTLTDERDDEDDGVA